MSVNKLALIRYKTIDECLRNRFRKWTLEDLMEKVSEAVYEYEGITSGVSRRTIQADIQLMRSDKLGYNAPIVVKDKKYYTYEDASYSISKAPINPADVDKLKEVLGVLKQFSGFSYFGEMGEVIAKLENNLHKSTRQSRNCIQFESNRKLKGIEHLNPLYQAILHKKSLLLEYKSFKAKASSNYIVFPYLLKEYRNRWFLIGKHKKSPVLSTLALDRIVAWQELPFEPFIEYEGMDFDQYYSDLLGVTKSETDTATRIFLQFDAYNAPYILTKPLHHTQTLLRQDERGIIVSIDVVLNFELEKEILGFGECVKVLAPRRLQQRIKNRLEKAAENYAKPKTEATGTEEVKEDVKEEIILAESK